MRFVRRIILTLIFLFSFGGYIFSQEFTPNFDWMTISAMTDSYGAAILAENGYRESLEDILSQYTKSAASSSVIFATRFAERKALTNMRLWDSQTENYYYKRIYSLVRDCILPKTISTAMMCLRDPHKALYWGSFLYETCTDTKNLCLEFESIVTNSRLSFKDLVFLEINKDLLPFVDLASLGNGSIEDGIDVLMERLGDLSIEDVKMNFTSLKDLASAGVNGLTSEITSRFDGITSGLSTGISDLKERMSLVLNGDNESLAALDALRQELRLRDAQIKDLKLRLPGLYGKEAFTLENRIAQLMQEYESIRSNAEDIYARTQEDIAAVGGMVNSVREAGDMIAGIVSSMTVEDALKILFRIAAYDIGQWVSNYVQDNVGQYYTQVWKIQREERGSKTILSWHPSGNPSSYDAVCPDWAYQQIDPGAVSGFDIPKLEEESFRIAKTASGLDNMNIGNYVDDRGIEHSVRINKSYTSRVQTKYITGVGSSVRMFYGCSIDVTDSYYFKELKYQEVFDSYEGREEDMERKMQKILEECNRNDSGYVYSIVKEERHFYPESDERKLETTDVAVISSTCAERMDLDEGYEIYPCPEEEDELIPHSKECSMRDDEDWYTAGKELLEYGDVLASQLEEKKSEAESLNEEINALVYNLSTAGTQELAESLRRLIEQKRSDLNVLTRFIDGLQSRLDSIPIYYAQVIAEEDHPETHRIPYIMSNLEMEYNLTWTGEGHWDGYTYSRNAALVGDRSDVIFSCELSIARPKQYLFGFIPIHEARIGQSWELYVNDNSTGIVKEIDLKDIPTDKRKEIVDEAVREAQHTYPECGISVDYIKSDSTDIDDTEDTYHLLYASERLEAARAIETRLINIYGDLVNLERMMSVKMSVLDMLEQELAGMIDTDRRGGIAGEALERWKTAAGTTGVSVHEPVN